MAKTYNYSPGLLHFCKIATFFKLKQSLGNCRGSRVRGRGLEVEGRESEVEGRGSQVEGCKSKVESHMSRVT